ncbi:hypothetical protein DIPPA_03016 [Diplonema papillatum]|nr:hypothetical protein DIPPA_03016 [Diplonema papillatum]
MLPKLPVERYYAHFKAECEKHRSDAVPAPVEVLAGFRDLAWNVAPPTEDEFIMAAKKAKTHKAVGPDGIPNAVLKIGGLAKVLTRYCVDAVEGSPPEEWLKSETVPGEYVRHGPAPYPEAILVVPEQGI